MSKNINYNLGSIKALTEVSDKPITPPISTQPTNTPTSTIGSDGIQITFNPKQR